MTHRILRNGQLKAKCTSIPRKLKQQLLQEKGYSISSVWKHQAYKLSIEHLSHDNVIAYLKSKAWAKP